MVSSKTASLLAAFGCIDAIAAESKHYNIGFVTAFALPLAGPDRRCLPLRAREVHLVIATQFRVTRHGASAARLDAHLVPIRTRFEQQKRFL